MKKNYILSLLALLSVLFPLKAQLGMGKWRTHFAYNSVVKVAQSENKVFALSNGALFSVDKADRNIDFYTKINGLSDNAISQIVYDPLNKQLIIAYSNGNLDLMTDNGIVNIPDYYNKVISVDKNINHINISENNNMAYLSCNFGIIALNLKRKEIAESYYIGPNASELVVLNTAVHEGNIFALTLSNSTYRIYQASLSDPNLINYENWSLFSSLPGSGHCQSLVSFGGYLFLLRNNTLYRYNNAWESFQNITGLNLRVSNGRMVINKDNENLTFVNTDFEVTTGSGLLNIQDAEFDLKTNTYFLAALNAGVLFYNPQSGSAPQSYLPNGPAVNSFWDMVFSEEKLYAVPGGRWAGPDENEGYVMIYEDKSWKNIRPETGNKVLDFMQVTVDPLDHSHYFATSYGTGLYEFKDDQLVYCYNADNTSALTAAGGHNPFEYTRLDGGVFDSDGNFWFVNTESSKGIRVFKKDRSIIQLSSEGVDANETPGKILINQQNKNHKWILGVRHKKGISVFDDGGTLDDTRDDKSILHTSFPSSSKDGEAIEPKHYFCMAQEKSGTIWVGTDIGPILFHRPQDAFNSNFSCSQVIIPRNDGSGQGDLLLENEEIKAIVIDGANRKWLGTKTSGAYLLSENGQETIKHFTTANSPLLSNEILSIAINPVSGEVFFGTGTGLISYQSDAAEAGKTFQNVHAYPNPVRQGFTGLITITGLVENTQVKITDLNGNLVCETRSNGSLATWNGKDGNGRKVNTGIYLAMCISEDGKQSTITKILVIN